MNASQCSVGFFFMCVMWILPGMHGEKLLMLMVGGLRNTYLKDYIDDLPGFQQFILVGSKAESLIPQFPTMSFSNQHSLVTGLYPETHGFIGNFMWDEDKNEKFNMSLEPPEDSHWWQDSEPVWITAARQGKRSALYNWFGCGVKIRAKKPAFCYEYTGMPTVRDGMADFLWQTEDAINALINDTADLAGVYTDIINVAGHQFSPTGEELKGVLKWIDNEFFRIYYRLEDGGLLDDINVIIFSDHGMTEVSPRKIIHIEKYIHSDDYDVIMEFGPKASIWPKEDKLDEVYEKLKKGSRHISVYKKEDIPDDWHYKTHARVAPLTLVADVGWMIVTPENGFPVNDEGREFVAYSGFNNSDAQMKAVFIGFGPNFKEGVVVPPLSNVNLYQVMCNILRIKPAPNNGTWDAVKNLFQETPDRTFWNSRSNITIIVAICVAAIGLNMIYRRRTFKYV